MFSIPAINNQLEALKFHLGIDEDDDDSVKAVESDNHSYSCVRRYNYNGQEYLVASINSELKGDVAVSYNSSLWVVKKKDTF